MAEILVRECLPSLLETLTAGAGEFWDGLANVAVKIGAVREHRLVILEDDIVGAHAEADHTPRPE